LLSAVWQRFTHCPALHNIDFQSPWVFDLEIFDFYADVTDFLAIDAGKGNTP
jgi:hypothetical protein